MDRAFQRIRSLMLRGTFYSVPPMFVDGNGEILCYQKADRQVFADFLFVNSRFEKSSTEKDKYGYLERENGVYYFKLNLKIGLLKR